jgi:hypothetical protein
MRGGYPVRLMFVTEGGAAVGYWRVGSTYAGWCGHRHASKEDAEKCLESIKQKYIEKDCPKKAAKPLSKAKGDVRFHPCVHTNHCPSCEAKVGEMCKPYIRKRSRGLPRSGIVRYPHVTRLSKHERELPSG